MSNAIDLISAYNLIDARLRSIYRGKGNLQFSDLVRRCADLNKTVKKYEEELLTIARLRNAIVHNSTRECIVAEPCDEITRLSKHILDLLTAPPKLKLLKEKHPMGISESSSVKEAIVLAAKAGYSNLPVYRGERVVGILNNRRIVKGLGDAIEGSALQEYLELPCVELMQEADFIRYYCVLGQESTVQEAIDAFENNRKLLAVVVTESGVLGDRITNILTAYDLPELISLLED